MSGIDVYKWGLRHKKQVQMNMISHQTSQSKNSDKKIRIWFRNARNQYGLNILVDMLLSNIDEEQQSKRPMIGLNTLAQSTNDEIANLYYNFSKTYLSKDDCEDKSETHCCDTMT